MSNLKINDAFCDTQEKIKLVFEFVNSALFLGELPEVLLTIQPDKKKGKVAGFYQSKTLWKVNEEQIGQINICAEYLSRPWIDVAECVLHECVHLFCNMTGNPARGNYHNVAFKQAAEAHGLVVEKAKNGWAKTSLKPDTRKTLEGFLEKNKFEKKPLIYRELPPPKPINSEYVPKHIRFKCPVCGISINTPYPKPFEESFNCPKCQVVLVEVPVKRRNSK